MIIFSPHSKFTMQRLADHMANGAYFYFSFDYDCAENKSIHFFLEKFRKRYDLALSPRQRNYRLETNRPICTLILQQNVFNRNLWHFYFLFTTPLTRDFNAFNGIEVTKIAKQADREKIEKLKEKFTGFKWHEETISAEIKVISDYFEHGEQLSFALKNSIAIKVTQKVTLELFRDTHKTYKQLVLGDGKEYKDRVRSYTWTWRYTQKTLAIIKKAFLDTINRLNSQKQTASAEKNRADLKNLFLMVETWSVFKANREQAGQILHFVHRYLQRRMNKTWQKISLSSPHLTYLPRLPNYADTIYEYIYRRSLFMEHGFEIPLDLIKDYYRYHNNTWIHSYVYQELERRKNSGEIARKMEELHLKILD